MNSVPNDWAMYEHDGNVTVSLMMQEIKVLLSTQTLPKRRFEKFLARLIKSVNHDPNHGNVTEDF